MTYRSFSFDRGWRLALLALTLLGFLGQVALQAFAGPMETPRAAITRLLGVDIAAAGSASAMAGMSGMDVAGCAHAMAQDDCVGGSGHSQDGHAGGQHDESCPLCPLLHIGSFLLESSPFAPGISSAWLAVRLLCAAPRAPPTIVRSLPPSRGPPFFASLRLSVFESAGERLFPVSPFLR
ncbi:hypothetical protein AA23498_3504 [Acetobacter nitrogenifigens DSM 23921 = NBRC 105050]|uniref:DUF2946 domain-containing protein n=1 Tax=Acetobacter nitrogenifigens DSM 23921 = NBRC 105050 TaxID=1120919 RepID=A0A511XEI7_9PROT|nr:DUF2946 family protein [Acetobacter nitrogenifigens]GBQ99590.1 hypothetical protein AA23498_3504 [Acetobacter nitrogenifigens DSM 23921 = NBRC 105050]GEN61369.1 hypothetical protein ANI02nite_32530 [Acetobacter nitrogenifigens DSM 23921 = NBRC 105050]